MAGMNHDRRSHKRVVVGIYSQWAIEPAASWRQTKILDVSLLGASFQVDEPLPLDRPVVFALRAPDVPMLPALADLQWWRRLTSGPTLQLGVKFRSINSEWAAWVSLAGAE